MIVIQKEEDEKVSIKIEKGTKNVEMIMGCVFLVEALKKELNTDAETIFSDIKTIMEHDTITKKGSEE